MDIDEAVVGGKGFTLDLEAVTAERKIANDELAGVVGGEGAVELETVAGEFDAGLERKIVGAGDFQAEFSGIGLGTDGKRQQRKN